MQHVQNITQKTQDALGRAVEIDRIEMGGRDVRRIITTHPALMIVSANVVSKMHRKLDLLDRIRTSFRQRKIDLVSISQLLETTDYDEVELESILNHQIHLAFLSHGSVLMEFVAKKRISEAEVLRVEAFQGVVSMTTENPTLLTYVGPNFLVRNMAYNCFQGIHSPTEQSVEILCHKRNYTYDALSQWIPKPVEVNMPGCSQRIDEFLFVDVVVVESSVRACVQHQTRLYALVPHTT